MGMAASQARFLGLTAKKTNIEYEGQQVNQQRMALGSQTASYYTQLLGFGVPTPPSIDQFTKMVYSWKPVGGSTNTILQMIPVTGKAGKYYVRYSYQQEVTAAAEKGETAITCTDKAKNIYKLGTQELSALTYDTANKKWQKDGKDLTAEESKIVLEEIRAVQKLLWLAENPTKNDKDFDSAYDSTTTPFKYKPLYVSKDETNVGSQNTYLTADQVKKADETNPAKAMQYKVGQVTQNQEATEEAELRFDDAGRPIGIKPASGAEEMALSASSLKDEVGYDMAMNKYEMEKFQYQKNMEDMNSKIKIMQEQDRSLELRLKQLDTEQKAVSTEMEAVSKIIQKNVESTFKTFG